VLFIRFPYLDLLNTSNCQPDSRRKGRWNTSWIARPKVSVT